jgi:NAD(P)-dependent dehydrogenase (short-subunit alcohol dehydrogenase family)
MSVWFVTGAARGMGASFVEAALGAGHQVVATARRPEEVTRLFGERDDLVAVRLDVTSQTDADHAAATAVERFGRIDVVVNSAGASYKGYFEEMSPRQVEQQLAVNLLGPMNVTRAILPVMRHQRSGHLMAISSGAGLVGFEFSSVYAASKAGLEGWMGALAQEVAPFGIHTTIVNPGFFRTGLASPESLVWPEVTVEDYAERSAAQREWWQAQDGRQPGDPAKLAQALLAIAAEDPPPARFIAGADVIALAERRMADLRAQIESHRVLSTSLTVDE